MCIRDRIPTVILLAEGILTTGTFMTALIISLSFTFFHFTESYFKLNKVNHCVVQNTYGSEVICVVQCNDFPSENRSHTRAVYYNLSVLDLSISYVYCVMHTVNVPLLPYS